MKRIARFLRSMRFGMLLLGLIVLCSLAGSFIAQGQPQAYYLQEYPKLAGVICALGLDRVFSTKYFIAIVALLCVNLLGCSVLRVGSIGAQKRAMPQVLQRMQRTPLPLEKAQAFLRQHHFRPLGDGVWAKNRIGHYGTFCVHLSMILLLASAGAVLGLATKEDVPLRVGESLTLANGRTVLLEAYRSQDEEGQIDYVSSVSLGDGVTREIAVNHPLTVGNQKLYQTSYGADGRMTLTVNGQASPLTLTDEEVGAFLTLDGQNGVVYMGIFPDYTENADGTLSPLRSAPGGFVRPAYAAHVIDHNETRFGVVLPGTVMEVGDMTVVFEQPQLYSVFTVKTSPQWAYVLLYASFVLLLAGLWLAFFQSPVYAIADEAGCAVRGLHAEPALADALEEACAEAGKAAV